MYRERTMVGLIAMAVEEGHVSQEDADLMRRFVGLAGAPSFNIYILARTGKLEHL